MSLAYVNPEARRQHERRTAVRKSWAANAVPDEDIDLRRPGGHRGDPQTVVVIRTLRASGVPAIQVASPMESYRKGFAAGFAAAVAQAEQTSGRPSCRHVIKAVAAHYGMTLDELLSQSRVVKLAWARQVAAYLARHLTLQSLPELGRRFGGRDHTTILHSARKVERLMAANPAIAAEVNALRQRIEGAR